MSLNFSLIDVPERSVKPREAGITMVMDKGLSVREAEDMVSGSGSYIDIIKLGFGSSYVTPNLEKKIEVFRSAGIPVYFGGTLLEAFIIRNKFDDYLRLLEKIIWETPQKSQQVYFITHFGANVNMGNIATNDVIALESLRVGLRSDTFFQFLNNGIES